MLSKDSLDLLLAKELVTVEIRRHAPSQRHEHWLAQPELPLNSEQRAAYEAIHAGLGPGGQVKARRVAADESRVTIDAVADDYTTVDAVKRRLAAMPVFSSVEIKGAKNVPDKKQVEFQLDLKLAGSRESGS